MAEQSLKTNLIFWVKACPWLYRLLWKFGMKANQIMVETLRRFGRSLRLGFRVSGPNGFFYGLDILERGVTEGRVLVEGQELPSLPLGDSLIRRTDCNQNGRQPWPVFWLKMHEARLVGPSLALVNSEKRLMIESVYGEEFATEDPSNNYLVLPGPVKLQGSWTSIISRWSGGYYHWFNDALPRLSPLAEFSPETGILIRGPLNPYQRESLKMLGLLDRVRETTEKHLVIEEYYFSSPPGMTGCTNPHAANWLRGKFLHHGTVVNTPPKFFVTRRGKTRGIINQKEVAEFFSDAGWAVVDLEDLSLVEQISWFSNAKAVVGEHGGGFTNLVWCRPGTKVMELCADNFLNGCYEGVSLCNELQHRFLILAGDSSSRIKVTLTLLKDFLQECDASESVLQI